MCRVGVAVVLAVAMLSGCGKQEVVKERLSSDNGRDPINAAKAEIDLFVIALSRYEQSVGSFPTTQQGLQALRTQPPDLPKSKKWNGPYLNPEVSLHPLNLELPLDPWGHPYHYCSPGIHNPERFDVWSVGPDGIDGTKDDIGNWK